MIKVYPEVYPYGGVHLSSAAVGALSKEMVRRPGVEARRLSPGAMQPVATEAQWPGTPVPRSSCAMRWPEEVRVKDTLRTRSSLGEEPTMEVESIPIRATVPQERRNFFKFGSDLSELEFPS